MAKEQRGGMGCVGRLLKLVLIGVLAGLALSVVVLLLARKVPVSGLVTDVQNAVETQPADEEQWAPAINQQLLRDGDALRTAADSSALVTFFDVSTINLAENTELGVTRAYANRKATGGHLALRLTGGEVDIRMVRFIKPGTQFVVETKVASTALRGAQLRVSVAPDSTTTVTVDIGEALITTSATQRKFSLFPRRQGIVVGAGGVAIIDPNGQVQVAQSGPLSPDELPSLIDEASALEGGNFNVIISEQTVNDFVVLTDTSLEEFGLSGPTIWFSQEDIVIGGDLGGLFGLPIGGPFTLVVTPAIDSAGAVSLTVKAANILGISLPVGLLNRGIGLLEASLNEFVTPPDVPVTLTSVEISEGSMAVGGSK